MTARRTKKPASPKARLSAQDIYRLRLATGVSLSPDEKRVAYSVHSFPPPSPH